MIVWPHAASAQDAGNPREASPIKTTLMWLGGGLAGLGIHESGHVVTSGLFGAEPSIRAIRSGPIPFFAITHRNGVPDSQEALISGAGFLSQHVTSEIVLSRRATGDSVSAFEKGLLGFHVATSAAYAGAAFARYGPHERDTRGIADATHTDERVIGALVLAPAAFDTWRYFRPESKVARWGSRLSKVAFLGVILFKP